MQTKTAPEFNVAAIRAEFPILKQQVYGKPLVYLDNAATSHKPQCVIDTINHFYAAHNSNVHRGVHYLSQLATRELEGARDIVKKFLNAASDKEVIFTKGTTDGINLVALSYGRKFIKAGDEIIISAIEHHANIVPWQMLCEQTGAVLRVIPINDDGELPTNSLARRLALGAQEALGRTWRLDEPPYHLWEFTPGPLRALIAGAGLTVESFIQSKTPPSRTRLRGPLVGAVLASLDTLNVVWTQSTNALGDRCMVVARRPGPAFGASR